ncbi:aminotransferase class I/II-fold pyridoxal phosphate-dependent enzyme [Paraburkholderia sprentiae WSM5005]|uniref:Aminotransferase class I/II-fold pyridoxal phosphate-dependent enzyme n=1 Tax=Paraburkholderia sprentiae WSM5005 TaxID=754502 RepID=A0A1I9YLI6_9BURK|nr:aminotransferase class I/II-fold pyridoxal phosphate-dependent enzyme [Paraburkholderia sprentiae]APA87169.2 aminotransferase class I/II-fold pyridoxal phosphate-dependent enzyme [Paraburkholderia sprentiae WSM5005]
MADHVFEQSTMCVHRAGASTEGFQSFSTPVYRASTIVFPNAQSYRDRSLRFPDGYSYGLMGTPTTRSLEEQLTRLAGGVRSVLVPSGQAAVSALMLTLLSQGDHVLIPDNVYPPVKQFSQEVLQRYGVAVDIYDPMNLQSLRSSIRIGRTKLIWIEAPGSTTMEVCDTRAIVSIAKENGVLTGCDNTWATSLFCKPISLGVDVVAEALTKYVGGHSDLLLGALSFASMDLYLQVKEQLANLGVGVSPDDCSLALRGIETMSLRLAHVGSTALAFAQRLKDRPGIARVIHPALPKSPGHEFWKRDFQGSTGVFSVQLQVHDTALVDRALGRLELFAIGASWGGTRSLVAPMSLDGQRSFGTSGSTSMYLRFSVGLESPLDLWRDIELMLSAF